MTDPRVEVFSVEEGRWVADVNLPESSKDVSAAGPRVFYVPEAAPHILKAVDMASQKVLWQHPIQSQAVVPLSEF